METGSKKQSSTQRKKIFKSNGLEELPVVVFLAESLKEWVQIISVN
jgi:hypothetical protein